MDAARQQPQRAGCGGGAIDGGETTMQYRIENMTSGADLGTYSADSEDSALDAMARDAGYASYADLQQRVPGDEGEIVVTEVDDAAIYGVDVERSEIRLDENMLEKIEQEGPGFEDLPYEEDDDL